jgi:hypothetical protein
MNKKIKCITEAYSMQPITLKVGDKMYESLTHTYYTISFIEFDHDHIQGFDEHGREVFRYLADSVNINFYYTEE